MVPYVFISSCARFTVNKPKNVIGPTNAVDTETKTETITSRIRVNFSYDIPRLIASARPKSNTSK